MESPQGWEGDGEKMKECSGWVKWEELKERERAQERVGAGRGGDKAKNRGVKKTITNWKHSKKYQSVCLLVYFYMCENGSKRVWPVSINEKYDLLCVYLYVNNLLGLYCVVLQAAGMRWAWALSVTGTELHHMRQLYVYCEVLMKRAQQC